MTTIQKISLAASVVAAVCGVVQIVLELIRAWIHRHDEDVQLRCTIFGECWKKNERLLDDWVGWVRVRNIGKRTVSVTALKYTSTCFTEADVMAGCNIKPVTIPAHGVADIPAQIEARYPDIHIPDDMVISCVTDDGLVIPAIRDDSEKTEDKILGYDDENNGGCYVRVRRQRSYH